MEIGTEVVWGVRERTAKGPLSSDYLVPVNSCNFNWKIGPNVDPQEKQAPAQSDFSLSKSHKGREIPHSQIMAHQPPITPDSRKKKPALPSLLSNLRNAHSAIATSVVGTSEARPLVSGTVSTNNGQSSSTYTTDRSNMKRSVTASLSSSRAPSAFDTAPNTRLNTPAPPSFSSALTNFQQRFENTWRNRNQHLHKEDDSLRHNTKRRRQIRVSIPQAFLLSSTCFFIAIPLLVLLYVLAKKSVFGDEGVDLSEHKYEVKAFDGEMTVENQQTALGELENQFKDADVNAAAHADVVGSDSTEMNQEELYELGVSGKANVLGSSQDGQDGNGPQESDVSDQIDQNLRGYQPPDTVETKEESIISAKSIEDESDPKIDSSGNMLVESKQNSIVDNSDAEFDHSDSDKGSAWNNQYYCNLHCTLD